MDERIKTRMQDSSRTGMGAGFAANQRLSLGLSPEDAEKAAQEVRGEVTSSQDPKKEDKEAEITPPDKKAATTDEVETAKQLIGLMRDVQQHETIDNPNADPLLSEKLRKSIEDSLEPIDLGMLFFHGYAEQTVKLFDGKLVVCMKTLSSEELSITQRWIENWVSVQLSPTQKFKLKNQVQCALQIVSVNGDIPADLTIPEISGILQADFKEMSQFLEKKLNWLLALNPDILDLLVLNIVWFRQRVRRVVASNAYVGQELKKS